jgi:RNA polymerase sigma factor for flagellar operon FliA
MDAATQTYRNVSLQTRRDELIVQHLGFVRHVLGRVLSDLPEHVDRENLESAGVLGLVEAAGQFDPTRGVAFTTFAYPRVRGAILDELRRNCPLPQQILQQWARIREASSLLPLPITTEALAAATDLTCEQVEACLAAIRMSRFESFEDLEQTHPESPCRAPAVDEERPLDEAEQRQLLADAIEELPQQMRLAITMYHKDDLRMREIGTVLGLSESRVSRILAAAELRLKTHIHRRLSPAGAARRCSP